VAGPPQPRGRACIGLWILIDLMICLSGTSFLFIIVRAAIAHRCSDITAPVLHLCGVVREAHANARGRRLLSAHASKNFVGTRPEFANNYNSKSPWLHIRILLRPSVEI
jgi:hypothetical protein